MAGDTAIKSFVSSATTPQGGAENERTVEIDGVEVTFMLPDLNQVVLATSMIEGATSNVEAGAALINIFFGLIKPEELVREPDEDDDEDDGEIEYVDFGARELERKMMNPRDGFGIETIAEVMGWLLEEWSARPTTPSSRSAASPSPGGKASKARQRGAASTRGGTAR